MTDISKYKNVSLSKDTYNKIDKIRRVMIPEMVISRSQTITLLVNEKQKKLNGRIKNVEDIKRRKKNSFRLHEQKTIRGSVYNGCNDCIFKTS